jgi:molybdopterin converting factor small subunit
MSATIELSPVFASFTDNQLSVPVNGKTLGKCLDELMKKLPNLKKLLLDKKGRLMRNYNIYINGKNVYPLDMKRPVADGDKLNIVFIVTGG